MLTRRHLFLGVGIVALVVGGRALFCAPLEPGALRPAPARLGDGSDPARLERAVRFFAETVGPRGQRHPEAMRQAADHLAEAFEAHGAGVERQPTPVGHPPFENVIGRFGPDDGARATR